MRFKLQSIIEVDTFYQGKARQWLDLHPICVHSKSTCRHTHEWVELH